MEHGTELAESGIALAQSPDVQACCAELHAWAVRVLRASAVAVAYDGELGSVQVGTPPTSDGPGELPAGWHRVDVRHPDGDQHDWTAILWFADPAAGDWRHAAQLLARQAAVGFARAASRADLQRHERQQHALVEAGKALSSERTLDGVLRRIVEHAMELTGARYGALGVLDESHENLAAFVTVGIDEHTKSLIGELPRGRGILGVLIDDPRPLRLARLQDDPRSVGFPEHHPPMASFLGVPIVTARSVAGRIYLTEKTGADAFSEEDERLVETLASQAAIAIDNAALNDQLQVTAAELTEASRHKTAFLANMSHELRSPLNTIIGYSRLLLDDPRGLDQEQIEDLEIVRGSSEHLLALITDLLDLQRIEAGRVTLVLDDENLRSIVEDSVASIRPSLANGVELVADLSALEDPHVRVDRTRVRQIMLNVLGNAVKFTESGSVTVRVADGDDRITIAVQDTGPGIPEADRQRIFESFFQSQAALDRTPGAREGAGLGLAITRMLTELHGGRVWLESAVGSGTTVTIELPRIAGVQA